MYWYWMEHSFGRFSVVGTTVKKAESMPKDLLADEKHTRRKKEKFLSFVFLEARQFIALLLTALCQ